MGMPEMRIRGVGALALVVVGCNGPREAGEEALPASTASRVVAGTVELVNQNAGQCADVEGRSDGARLAAWGCTPDHSDDAQLFQLDAVNDGFRIRHLASGKCVAPRTGSLANGTQLELAPCSSAPQQIFERAGLSIRHRDSGKCLEVASGPPTSGTPLRLWTCRDRLRQKWEIVGVSGEAPDPEPGTGSGSSGTGIVEPWPEPSCQPVRPSPTRSYWVAVHGNDANPGTQAAPFATLKKAASVVDPGEEVVVAPGTYTTTDSELAYVTRGGSEGKWITFRSETPLGARLDGRDNATGTGFSIEASYVRIEGFDVGGFQHQGVSVWRSHVEIRRNWIHDIGRRCTDSEYGQDGIYTYLADDVVIDGNRIERIGRFEPGEDGCSPTLPYYMNHDHGIYTSSPARLTVTNNVFVNHGRGWPIQVYNGGGGPAVTGLLVAHNTFVGASPYRDGHIILDYPGVDDGRIANNVFDGPRGAAIVVEPGTLLSSLSVDHNLVSGASMLREAVAGVATDANLEGPDPLFVDASANDFRLAGGSPAVDAGVGLGVVTDFDGKCRPAGAAPDLGAFER